MLSVLEVTQKVQPTCTIITYLVVDGGVVPFHQRDRVGGGVHVFDLVPPARHQPLDHHVLVVVALVHDHVAPPHPDHTTCKYFSSGSHSKGEPDDATPRDGVGSQGRTHA